MKKLLEELQRRKVTRIGASYLVAAWLIMQVVNEFFPPLGLPEWSQTLVAVLILIGFPFALLLAWAFEVTPDGIKPERVSTGNDSELQADHRPPPAKALITLATLVAVAAAVWYMAPISRDWAFEGGLVVGLMILILAGFAYNASHRPAKSIAEEGLVAPAEISIAVLPFRNLSSGPDSEYFGDGMAEELLNVLARIDGWRVAARTSCFYFKGRNEKVQVIGQELGVGVVLDGSVRTVDGRVRVSAQLSNVEDGYELWSDSYDQTLDDVLKVQDEIAHSIVGALRGKLGDDETTSSMATEDSDAFRCYLEGRSLWQRRDPTSMARGIKLLEKAVDLDPGYARAFATLAAAYHKLPLYDSSASIVESGERAEAAAKEALRLDPAVGEAYATLGSVHAGAHRFREAGEQFDHALRVEPNDATALHWHAIYLLNTGQLDKALQQISLALRLDPLNGAVVGTHACIQYALSQIEPAIESFSNAARLGWTEPAEAFLGAIQRQLGHPGEAADYFRRGRFGGEPIPEALIAAMTAIAVDLETNETAGALIVAGAKDQSLSASFAFRLCALIGSDRIFELCDDAADISSDALAALWFPPAKVLRGDDRFKGLLARFNL